LPAVDPAWASKFAATKQSAGEQSELGDPTELVKLFDTCADKLSDVVKGLSAAELDGPPSFKGPFATNFGEGVLFGVLHIAMHIGQLSTIRRSLGKPPVV
jgi:hypothetical protein